MKHAWGGDIYIHTHTHTHTQILVRKPDRQITLKWVIKKETYILIYLLI
jgi:hypothetical protein